MSKDPTKGPLLRDAWRTGAVRSRPWRDGPAHPGLRRYSFVAKRFDLLSAILTLGHILARVRQPYVMQSQGDKMILLPLRAGVELPPLMQRRHVRPTIVRSK